MAVALLNKLSRWAVDAALDEFVRIGRDAFLQKYRFGAARNLYVLHPESGIACDSKAIAGAAYGLQFPEQGPLQPDQFSGGVDNVVKELRRLGYEVVDERLAVAAKEERGWARDENELIVQDYLEMLMMELKGQPYNKAARARELMPRLHGRTKGSIERKRANISAVLTELGVDRINGYKPAPHVQREALLDVVAEKLEGFPVLRHMAEKAADREAVVPRDVDFKTVRTEAPKQKIRAEEPQPAYVRRPIKLDYVQREARNRSLGRAGELFVVQYEKWRLTEAGVGLLADRVEHVSETQGDGLGYDVLSFEADGRERFIEVKTTAHDAATPFFVSANEVAFAREQAERFWLYRLFRFRTNPQMFELKGEIEHHCHMDPAIYRATLG